jgi:hypothetical protein
MSFGNSTVFPFPAVQYIPLPLSALKHDRIATNDPKMRQPHLAVGAELQNLQARLANHENPGPVAFPTGSLPLLALNLQIDTVKYRGHLVTMLGRATPGVYQLTTIPQRYFYKKTLIFELYDQDDYRRLARRTVTL